MRIIQEGTVEVLGGDMASKAHRKQVCPRIAYMPQGLGKTCIRRSRSRRICNSSRGCSVMARAERRQRIDELTQATGLFKFLERPGRQAVRGHEAKLGLCCALIHDPDFLILDEPTTGVDPLARAQFWDLIDRIRADRPGMSVIVATAYMDEAQRFDWLAAIDDGKVLATGTPKELLEQQTARTWKRHSSACSRKRKSADTKRLSFRLCLGGRRGRYRHRSRGADHALWRLRCRRQRPSASGAVKSSASSVPTGAASPRR